MPSSSFPPPLHPSIASRLSSEYKLFYSSHPSPVLILTDTWDPSIRDPSRRAAGPKTSREPVAGVGRAEIEVRWGEGEGLVQMDDGLGGKAGKCKVGVYWPIETTDREKEGNSLSVFVYIPGGGFVLPAPGPEPNSFISRVCRHTPCVVIVPRTRLAPEDPWPAPVEDAMGVCRWVLEGEDGAREVVDGMVGKGRVEWGRGKGKRAVGGASAGGCLAAVVALHLPSHIPPRALLLLNPLLDNSSTPNPAYGSHASNAHCPDLPIPLLNLFRQLYLPPTTPVALTHPLVSPMYASTEVLKRLGRVWVCAGECDSVRDEGVFFAQKVVQAGGLVQLKVYEGAAHGYTVQDAVLEVGRQYIDDVIQELKLAFE